MTSTRPRTLEQIDRDIQQVCHQVERTRLLLPLLYAVLVAGIAVWVVYPLAGPWVVFCVVPALGVLMLVADARLGRHLARLRTEADTHRGMAA